MGQSTEIQQLDKKRPTLSNLNQTQNRRRYVNFENGSHFICELTVFIVFKMTNIASGDQEIVNSLIGNNNKKVNAKFITFYKTFGRLGLLISKTLAGAYVAIATMTVVQSNQISNFLPQNQTVLNGMLFRLHGLIKKKT